MFFLGYKTVSIFLPVSVGNVHFLSQKKYNA